MKELIDYVLQAKNYHSLNDYILETKKYHSLNDYINEAKRSNITLSQVKKIVNGVECEIENSVNGGFNLKFEEDDYWDFEEDDLTPKLMEIYNKLSEKTTVVRWDDRSWLLVKKEFQEVKPTEAPENNNDVHKVQKNGLSLNDEDLIDLAQSTTYRSSIREYIKIADTPKAKKILQDILKNGDVEWED